MKTERTFEIINPSDKAFISGDDEIVVSVATMLFSLGKYGLQEVDGEYSLPILAFGGGEEWMNENGIDNNGEWMKKNKEGVIKALRSVRLDGERTSMNDIVSSANERADNLENYYAENK